MTRTKVESTLLASHGWEPSADDPTIGTLEIEFPARGNTPASVYQYSGVPFEVWEAHHNAESHGKHFLANIKGKYPFKKVEAPKPDAAPQES